MVVSLFISKASLNYYSIKKTKLTQILHTLLAVVPFISYNDIKSLECKLSHFPSFFWSTLKYSQDGAIG
jgi:hypothetical protein